MSEAALAAVAGGVTAFAVSFAVVRLLLRARLHGHLLDMPNHRSLHASPVPRGGGIGILAGVSLAYLMLLQAGWLAPVPSALLLAAGLLGAVSLLDDARPLPARVRLGVQLAAAGILLAGVGTPGALTLLPGWTVHPGTLLSALLVVGYVVWMSNLYNFMDGMDGLAGTMAVIGFGCFAALGALAGAWPLATLSLLVAAATLGFLVHNLPPARIFLGDVGSVPLGFLAAAFTLQAQRDGVFPLWIGVLVFSPFVVDATVTLLRRLLARERVWEAHRDHQYQRLVRGGWSHGRTLRWAAALMLACALSAVSVMLVRDAAWAAAVGLGWAIGYTALVFFLSRHWARSADSGHGPGRAADAADRAPPACAAPRGDGAADGAAGPENGS